MFKLNLFTLNINFKNMVSPIKNVQQQPPKQQHNRSKIIIMEGNISAGKTYLSQKLGEHLGYKVFFEPTTTNPYLSEFYKDPTKYALVMQLWLLNQRYNTYLNALSYSLKHNNGVILDRSVYSDWVFAENCRVEGLISKDGFQEYLNAREKLLSDIPLPNMTIYLDVSPQECLKRIQTIRKRECEQSITLEYLQGLDLCYNKFLDDMMIKNISSNKQPQQQQVLRVDWNQFGNPFSIVDSIKLNQSFLSDNIDLPHLNYDLIEYENMVESKYFKNEFVCSSNANIKTNTFNNN
ncbi:deoxyguanosine kinase [Tieghemostelium lacteum]|uniref:Deoxyguanosine kinase n=1 Tax=Tieghemostelium lacteum TaxID=361077 RepID=A0A152A5P7_TIELA|nr:deoxyguanosine kinase [Tieghemostelium lacteum]|eukprot:KYR01425.1 deoxyguanosine kinase [Tieghemostelium lacteum]